jgi:LmbE family N-acetylglucosaminyl deacetylase
MDYFIFANGVEGGTIDHLIEQCATLTYCCFSSGNWKDTDTLLDCQNLEI